MDFEANAKDGVAVDWPIRYKDIKKWYDYAEEWAGISGQKEGLANLPDGNFLPPMELNCVEQQVRKKVAELPAAAATGNMTLRPFSNVTEVIYDKNTKKASGVRVMDTETKEMIDFHAKIVFVCASCIPTTQILMQSANDVWEGGLGSSSGELGHNIMDHHFRLGARGVYDGFNDRYYKGRRANGIYIPRFQNLPGRADTKKKYLRGFGYQGGASRTNWSRFVKELSVGKPIKELVQTPGPWSMGMTAFGECLPYHENKMTLNRGVTDIYGQPTVTFDAEWKENEWEMRKDMTVQAAEILEAAGFKDVKMYDSGSFPRS